MQYLGRLEIIAAVPGQNGDTKTATIPNSDKIKGI